MNLHDIGEFGLIRHLSTRLATRNGVRLGVGDDAAVLDSLRAPVVTTDALIEGVHFRRDWTTPRLLGRKAMAVNVSDIAAMGARPVAAFVTLAVSTPLLESGNALEWIEELYTGMEEIASEYQFSVAGGDTTRALHDVALSVTIIGESMSTPVLRSGARPGDALIVTGTLGDSAAGLWLLQNPQFQIDASARGYLLARHFNPTPRLREIEAVLQQKYSIHAALDLSDGIAGDALHIAGRSQVSLEIEIERLPVSEYSRQTAQLAKAHGYEVFERDWALNGGEDYELLLCVPGETAETVCAAITHMTSTPATIIGRCVPHNEKEPITFVCPDGRRETSTGAFRHF